MDPAIFTKDRSGELRKYSTLGGSDGWLFIPHPLPPTWEFPPKLWPLLVEARDALGTLNGIGQLLPNPELLMRPLRSQEAITSSSIEGTFVTPQQLLLYELEPDESGSSSETAADLKEVWNYSAALLTGLELLQSLPLASRVLREMHKVLMQGVRGHDKSPGEFRAIQNQIGQNARYVPPPPSELAQLMGNFDNFINLEVPHFDPLVDCFVSHYQFEAIHPFVDGNGRLGRALLALMIRKRLHHSLPWLYMSSYFEQYRDDYMQLLFRVSTHGDWTSWIEFCLHGAISQARDAVARCVLFNQAHKRYHGLIKKPGRRTHILIEQLFKSPVLTVSWVAEHMGISYQTAKKDLEKLVEVGIVQEIEGARQKTFMAAELVRLAYSPVPPPSTPALPDLQVQ